MQPVHTDAHALTAFRVLPDGSGRQYSATTFPNGPRAGCELWVRRAHAVYGLDDTTAGEDLYAVLDVLDVEGSVIQDYAIPNNRCFRYLKRSLGWVVETDG